MCHYVLHSEVSKDCKDEPYEILEVIDEGIYHDDLD